MTQVAVIGGGAAGLAAALAASQEGARVTVFEAGPRVGSKILASGNGRCNLTNMQLDSSGYNAPEFVAPVLAQWGPQRIRSWFAELGLATVEEREGRVYPMSNAAASVLDTLRYACRRAGVRILTGSKVSSPHEVKADGVVVATGGGSDLLAAAGHSLQPFSPVLCAIEADIAPIRGLSGIRAAAELSVLAGTGDVRACERGEVLFRDYGVSGVVSFDMSRYAQPGDALNIDLLPDMDTASALVFLQQRLAAMTAASEAGLAPSYEEFLAGLFHSRIGAALLRNAKCKPTAPVAAGHLDALVHAAKELRLQVTGPGDVKHAQLTRGGASLDEFDAATLASKLDGRLLAAGEVLDVDGRCGGYNLHWAWASGLAAGANAAKVG